MDDGQQYDCIPANDLYVQRSSSAAGRRRGLFFFIATICAAFATIGAVCAWRQSSARRALRRLAPGGAVAFSETSSSVGKIRAGIAEGKCFRPAKGQVVPGARIETAPCVVDDESMLFKVAADFGEVRSRNDPKLCMVPAFNAGKSVFGLSLELRECDAEMDAVRWSMPRGIAQMRLGPSDSEVCIHSMAGLPVLAKCTGHFVWQVVAPTFTGRGHSRVEEGEATPAEDVDVADDDIFQGWRQGVLAADSGGIFQGFSQEAASDDGIFHSFPQRSAPEDADRADNDGWVQGGAETDTDDSVFKGFSQEGAEAHSGEGIFQGFGQGEPAGEVTGDLAFQGFGQAPAPLTLYCWMIVRQYSNELDLLNLHRERGQGPYGCNGHVVFTVGGAAVAGLVHLGDDSSYQCYANDIQYVCNTQVFSRGWDKLLAMGEYRSFAWTVKLDPDAMFIADRLRSHLRGLDHMKPIYIANNRDFPEMLGPVEVVSIAAVDRLVANKDKCYQGDMVHSGEDGFFTQCFQDAGAKKHQDLGILTSTRDVGQCNGGTVTLHPLKSRGDLDTCYNMASR